MKKLVVRILKALGITFAGVTVPTIGALQAKSVGFMVYIAVVWFICLYYIGMETLERCKNN